MEKRYQGSELELIEGRPSKRLEEQSKTVGPNKRIVGYLEAANYAVLATLRAEVELLLMCVPAKSLKLVR